ncbi:DUF2336 domain-containing protein [Microbacteriaceae bacterium K1510]|nr:DUF2336 domain-containing protein [Microbacteriaceae bacterium K1510]
MGSPASLLPELEDVVQHGTAEKRAETLRRITSLFLDGATSFRDHHVALFDDVIGYLIEEIEAKALAELARRIAPVANAPAGVVSRLANSDDIDVAGPVLKQARLEEPELMRIAETKSQAHLLAVSMRLGISESLSDILVARGDREVARSIATNHNARLSEQAFTTLVQRAEQDGVLAEKVGQRTDIPPRLFRQLLMRASDVVQKRLLAQAKPETQLEIRKILAKVTDEVGAKAAPRNYTAALAKTRALHKERKLTEADIAEFANSGQYEETIAALATVCAVPVEVVDRLMNGERADPVLILARAVGFGWPTVKAVMSARPGIKVNAQILDAAFENFERLTAATAQRVVRFWQVRQGTGE